jgi:two-component system, OmpR family, sensor histidine kinase CreC
VRLGIRLLAGFFLITGLAAFFVLRVFVAEVKPSVREVMEDMLVDTANLLAEQAADDLAVLAPGGTLEASRFAQRVQDYAARPIDARIWGLSKRSLDLRVYVTDATGRVVFDAGSRSGAASAVGADYSRWRDVALTLRGEYGARATREVQADDRTSVMYVAAPVRHTGQVIGVLTVAKPIATVQPFIDRAERKILVAGVWLLGLSLAIGVVVSGWLVWSIRKLRGYAHAVGAGTRIAVPQLSGELGELAVAMDGMRSRLEGQQRVEHTVRALTHELKSPLAAIRGAAELLREPLPDADRIAFAAQIEDQGERLRLLVDRMLELSKLEARSALDHDAPVPLTASVHAAWQTQAPRAQQRRIALHWTAAPDESVAVRGDAELIELAMTNLLANALDFAPEGSRIEATLHTHAEGCSLELRDHGPGVPDYARAQLGQRFFSTARPGSERKGSGLGLAIVAQVMALHGGHWRGEPAQPGWRVRLDFPHAMRAQRSGH